MEYEEGLPPGGTSQQVLVEEENTLQLVSPKPVITTVTKQAEISPTNKFVSTRMVNLNANQMSYSILPIPDQQERIHMNSNSAKLELGEANSHPLVDSNSSHNLENKDEHSDENTTPVHDHTHASAQVDVRPKKKMMLTLQSDDSAGVRFILSNHLLEDNSKNRDLLASKLNEFASTVINQIDPELTCQDNLQGSFSKTLTMSSPESESQSSKYGVEKIEYAPDVNPSLSVIHTGKDLTPEPVKSIEQSQLTPTTSNRPRYPITSIRSQLRRAMSETCSNTTSTQTATEPCSNSVATEPTSLVALQTIPSNSSTTSLTSPTTPSPTSPATDGIICYLCNKPIRCSVCRESATPSNEFCHIHQFTTDDDNVSSGSDVTLSDSEPGEEEPMKKMPLSTSSSVYSTFTHVSDLPTPIKTPLSGTGLINPGFVFEFPNVAHLKPEITSPTGNGPSSPSLLDTLHKKYWANSNPEAMLSAASVDRSGSSSGELSKSEFRLRHESYCRVVDQNSDKDLYSVSTLPSHLSGARRVGTTDPSIRMFGNVDDMFKTLPNRASKSSSSLRRGQSFGSVDRRKVVPDLNSSRPALLQVSAETSDSSDRLTVPANNLPSTTSGSKLTRKFSLSPKAIRRKIIARLQQESGVDRSISSESEADDVSIEKGRKESVPYKKRDVEETPRPPQSAEVSPNLYRMNTFPRSRQKPWRRSASDGEAAISHLTALGSSSDTPTTSTLRGSFKRGLSEQLFRFGLISTLDRAGKVNRARKIIEIEVVEACTWLQEAGFPQYVQLYEDSQFPVDLKSVEKDHLFLDRHLLDSLFRRLQTLNKSVHMKLDINNKKPLYGSGLEDDEDDACVLSDKWRFERTSGRWSHIDDHHPTNTTEHLTAKVRSCSSRDSVMSDDTTEGDTGDSSSPILQSKNILNNHQQTATTVSNTNQANVKTEAAAEKRRGGRLFPKVGSLRRSSQKSRKDKSSSPNGGMTISGPTLLATPGMDEKMQRLGCVEISQTARHKEDLCNNNNTKLVRSASTDNGRLCLCDSYSIDSTVTEYMLPPDYVLGTFPKELLENQVKTSRKNSISSASCPHHGAELGSRNNNLTLPRNNKLTANRNSFYDNVPLEEGIPSQSNGDEPPPQINTTPQPESPPQAQTQTAKKELDTVLHDLLVNISSFDLDDSSTSDPDFLRYLSSSSKDTELTKTSSQVIDSAIVSPTSEDLASLTDTHSEAAATPADTPNLKRSDRPDITTSSDELTPNDMSGSREELDDATTDELREMVWRERRDSGVGSSLTREPMGEKKKKTRLRWHSFVASHRPSSNSQSQLISSLSTGHLVYLKRLALLKVTSLMEQYSPSHKSGFSLHLVNKFIKKNSKAPDYSDKRVFGVPLSVIVQRTGQPLPQCILHAMRYLRKSACEAHGIFRKSGVKSRIQKLRNDLEQDPDSVTQFESMQSYDVADMFKQYLRELPECLVTNKLSDTFLAIYQHIPQELRLEALQCCILLLPDENREVLESLLYFLSDMASFHEENHMTASNLAMCFAPSLFNIHNRSQSKSPKSDRKIAGVPDQREFQEQRSATDCLTTMIEECKKLFKIPDDFTSKCSLSYMEAGEPAPLTLLGADSDYEAHIDSCLQGLLKESKEKGWWSANLLNAPTSTRESVDIWYKKVHDGNALRLWKCSTEIEAPPVEVLHRVLNERQKWDEDLSKWRCVEKLDKQVDVFQYLTNSMAPQPAREYVVFRAWKTDLPKGACVLVMHSIDYETRSLNGGGIRGMVLASRYLIEPCGSGKSKLTHISRVDTRGREAKWYNRCYGSMAANTLLRIRESFSGDKLTPTPGNQSNVHETNV